MDSVARQLVTDDDGTVHPNYDPRYVLPPFPRISHPLLYPKESEQFRFEQLAYLLDTSLPFFSNLVCKCILIIFTTRSLTFSFRESYCGSRGKAPPPVSIMQVRGGVAPIPPYLQTYCALAIAEIPFLLTPISYSPRPESKSSDGRFWETYISRVCYFRS